MCTQSIRNIVMAFEPLFLEALVVGVRGLGSRKHIPFCPNLGIWAQNNPKIVSFSFDESFVHLCILCCLIKIKVLTVVCHFVITVCLGKSASCKKVGKWAGKLGESSL